MYEYYSACLVTKLSIFFYMRLFCYLGGTFQKKIITAFRVEKVFNFHVVYNRRKAYTEKNMCVRVRACNTIKYNQSKRRALVGQTSNRIENKSRNGYVETQVGKHFILPKRHICTLYTRVLIGSVGQLDPNFSCSVQAIIFILDLFYDKFAHHCRWISG